MKTPLFSNFSALFRFLNTLYSMILSSKKSPLFITEIEIHDNNKDQQHSVGNSFKHECVYKAGNI